MGHREGGNGAWWADWTQEGDGIINMDKLVKIRPLHLLRLTPGQGDKCLYTLRRPLAFSLNSLCWHHCIAGHI